MSHPQPCTVGFAGGACPECDARARRAHAIEEVIQAEESARRARDLERIRAELFDRLDRAGEAGQEMALRWIAWEHPDLVIEALTEMGAPQ